ncbi:hypothetical protein C0J52_27717, partial [Blattella germanica]
RHFLLYTIPFTLHYTLHTTHYTLYTASSLACGCIGCLSSYKLAHGPSRRLCFLQSWSRCCQRSSSIRPPISSLAFLVPSLLLLGPRLLLFWSSGWCLGLLHGRPISI